MLVIVNPYATGMSAHVRDRALRTLARGFAVEAVDTAAPGHAIELAAGAGGRGFDAVGAIGGDGTVNEVANGLLGDRLAAAGGGLASRTAAQQAPGRFAREPRALVHVGAEARSEAEQGDLQGSERETGHPPALACIPAGQANVLARMLGIPAEAQSAAQHVVALAAAGTRRVVDLGMVNGRGFTFASGVGMDASITRAVDAKPALKARLGPWFYTWAALSVIGRHSLAGAPRMSVRIPAMDAARPPRVLEGMSTVIQNGSPYTYFNRRPVELARRSALDSGRLAGCVLHRARPREVPALARHALSRSGRIADHEAVSEFSGVEAVTIESGDGGGLPVHVDGDYLGDFPQAHYAVLAGALHLIA
ncbi:MAG: diacylglycerol/lipid kinase family protein [Solirubrobacteraceae bacterium]